jgi:hypothetical protein
VICIAAHACKVDFKYYVEASRLALQFQPLASLDQEKESKHPGSEGEAEKDWGR